MELDEMPGKTIVNEVKGKPGKTWRLRNGHVLDPSYRPWCKRLGIAHLLIIGVTSFSKMVTAEEKRMTMGRLEHVGESEGWR